MDTTWIYLLLMAIIIPLITLYFINRGKQKETSIEPNFVHIFPDYSRENPYNAIPGEIIKFTVKGYTDEKQIEEISLIEKDITWKYQNYVGNIILKEPNSITYRLPIAKEKQGKISYVSVYYHKLKDTSWMRISI